MSETKRQSAEIRGDIQRGQTGDKVPGFDPAAAPMETDAEAGGASATPLGPDIHTQRSSANRNTNESSSGDAMRRFQAREPAGDWLRWLVVFAVLVAIVVVVFLVLGA